MLDGAAARQEDMGVEALAVSLRAEFWTKIPRIAAAYTPHGVNEVVDEDIAALGFYGLRLATTGN